MGATVRGQLARFLLVGLTTVAIDYLSYRLLLALAAGHALAKTVSFVMGTVFAYFANRAWTFGETGSRAAPASALRFASLYGATLLCNVAANGLLLSAFAGHPRVVQLAFVIATALSATLNFLGMKFYVFAPRLPGRPS